MQLIGAIHKPSHIDPTIAYGRQLNDALGLLPGIRNGGLKRKAGFIKIIECELALVLLFLQGGKFTLTVGTCVWIAELLSRLSHPLPSKTCLFGQTFARRETEALLGCVGSTLSHPLERTGLFFDRLLRNRLFVWGECAGSATARLIRQTLDALLCPLLAPGWVSA
jgi:hypothetical protein